MDVDGWWMRGIGGSVIGRGGNGRGRCCRGNEDGELRGGVRSGCEGVVSHSWREGKCL